MSGRVQKVLFKDGDVITEKHFQRLEEWIEGLFGALALKLLGPGLLRLPVIDAKFNETQNVRVTKIQPGVVKVCVEKLRAVTPDGQLLGVYETLEKDLHTHEFRCDGEGYYYLYLAAGKITPPRLGEHLQTHPQLYDQPGDLSLDNSGKTGVCIGRFREEGNRPKLDESFVAPTITIFSSQACEDAHHAVMEELRSLRENLRKYLELLQSSDVDQKFAAFAGQLYRLWSEKLARLKHPALRCDEFFRGWDEAFNDCRTEIELLNYTNNELGPDDRAALQACLANLQTIHLDVAGNPDLDLHLKFAAIKRGLAHLEIYLGSFPRYKKKNIHLPIARLRFSSKEAGFGRLEMLLAEETKIAADDRLRIELTDFAKPAGKERLAELLNESLRFSAQEDALFNRLQEHYGLLQHLNGRPNCFRIEFAGGELDEDRLKMLTLFLPAPLGEGMENLENKVEAILQKQATETERG